MREIAGAAVAAAHTGRMARMAAVVAAAIALAASLATATAVASPNTGPSTAAPVGIGVPFSGNWPGTVTAHGESYNHWWRLPTTVRPGDSVHLAVDNRLGLLTIYFCLVPPIDDFGADQALDRCPGGSYVHSGRQDRVEMTYADGSGQGMLVAYTGSASVGDEAGPTYGQYAVTIERIVTRVNPGLVVPGLIPRTFTVSSPLVHGDNTPVGDGVGARLEWRYRPAPGRQPSPYTPLVDSHAVGGAATFTGTLPPEAEGRPVQLRVCASQPGGTTAICTADQNTTVQVTGPSAACVAATSLRAKRSRAVKKLKRKVRRAHTRRGKRVAKRKLRVAKRRYAASKRSVRANC